MPRTAFVFAGLLTAAASGTALADITWDEFADGDLSGNPDAPTALSFGLGGNTIIGSMAAPDDVRDYITFVIEPGHALVALLQHQYQDLDTGGPGDVGFHAINEGDTSWIPDADTIGFFLGGDHMGPETPGTDLLPDLANANLGGTGFAVPLGPGTYTYLVQQTGVENTGYTLEFVVTPAPGGLALLGLAGAPVLRRRRDRCR